MKLYKDENNKKSIIDIEVDIVYSDKVKINKDWKPSFHQHQHTELFYITDGNGKLVLKDSSIELNKNDFLIVNSNLKHMESWNEFSENDNFLEYYVIGIKGISIKELKKINDENKECKINDFVSTYVFKHPFSDKNNIFYQLLKYIYEESLSSLEYSKEYSKKLLELLIINILRLNSRNIEIEDDLKNNKQIKFIKKYIDNNFKSDINLDTLAKIGYINKYYLINQFKKIYGITPVEYIIKKRYAYSKYLLENSNYSMQEIATKVGFNSQSYFNQLFKKKTGLSPKKYRIMKKTY